MANKASVYLFDEYIADIYMNGDSVLVKQIDSKLHLASPIMIPKDDEVFETTLLTYLDKVPGVVSDSLPGNFGNEILDNYFLNQKGNYPTIIDKLLFIGEKGLGALIFKPSTTYDDNTSEILSLKNMFEEAKRLEKGKEYKSLHDAFLVSAHSFVGGARSKAIVSIDIKNKEVFIGDRTKTPPKGFIPAIIKYDDTKNDSETKSTYSKLEYIYYLLSKKCGLNMSPCYLLETIDGKSHFVTERFDISKEKRFHIHSLAGLLHIDYNIPMQLGYEDLLRTAVRLNVNMDSKKQLFSQMLFNYLFVNQDDHARNFSFMCDKDFKWKVTPAYDITFSKGKKQTIEHQLSLYGKALSKIDITDVVQLADEYNIKNEYIASQIEKMTKAREELPNLMEEYNIANKKQIQVLAETSKRTFNGAL